MAFWFRAVTVILAALLGAELTWAQVPAPSQDLQKLWSKAPRPRLPVTRCVKAPKIDGKLDDAAWTNAATAGQFTRAKGTRGNALWGIELAGAQTDVLICHDDEFLYLAFRCEEPYIEVLKTQTKQRDGSVWFDDCVEFFLDVTGDGTHIIHTITSAANTVYDADHTQGKRKWNMQGMQSATSRGDKVWFVEMAYPFASLGKQPPKQGDIWRVQFARERWASAYRALQENSVWTGQPESRFNLPERFGELFFTDVALTDVELPTLFLGKLQARIALHNATPDERLLTVTARSTAGTAVADPLTVKLAANTTREIVMPLLIDAEDTQIVHIQVNENDRPIAVMRRAYHVKPMTEPLAATIGRFEKMLAHAESGSELAKSIEEQLPGLKALRTQILNFRKSQLKSEVNDQAIKQWTAMGKRLDRFAMVGSYVIWQQSPWLPVNQRAVPPSLKDNHSVNLVAAQGETEAFCFAFSNLTDQPMSIRLQGKLPIKGQLYTSPITSLQTIAKTNPDSAHFKGMFANPESLAAGEPTAAAPLIPTNGWNELLIPAGETRQLWGLLDTRGIEPGKYRSSFVVRALNRPWPDRRISLGIEVWPFEIPAQTPLDLFLFDYASSEQHIRDMVEHRVNTFLVNCNPQRLRKQEKAVRLKLKHGRRVFGSYGIIHEFEKIAKKQGLKRDTEAYKQAFGDYLDEWVQTLQEMGASYDQIALQHYDEPYGDAIGKIIELGPTIRQRRPELKLVLTGMTPIDEVKQIAPYTDIFGFRGQYSYEPFTSYYAQLQADEDKEIWTFTCGTPVMEMPPISYWRTRPWLCKRYNWDGIMIFCWAYLVHWEWGQNATVGPISTRGYEAIRQGMEDYCLLVRLETEASRIESANAELANEARALLDESLEQVAVAPGPHLTERELGMRLEDYRARIGATIVKLIEME